MSPINPLDTAVIYKVEYTDKNSDKGYYIGVTKWKIDERIIEHQGWIKNGKNKATIARLALNKNIKIDFNKAIKLSNWNNRTYRYCCEIIEIKTNNKTCNDIEQFFLDLEWQQIIN